MERQIKEKKDQKQKDDERKEKEMKKDNNQHGCKKKQYSRDKNCYSCGELGCRSETKHIRAHYHFVREAVSAGEIEIVQVRGSRFQVPIETTGTRAFRYDSNIQQARAMIATDLEANNS